MVATREELNQEMIKVMNDPDYASEISSAKISNKEAIALKIFSVVMNKPPPNPEERKFLQDMLVTSLGNINFNTNVGIALKSIRPGSDLDMTQLQLLRTFTFKTRNLEKFNKIANKMQEVNQYVQLDRDIDDPKKRLSLKEFALIQDISKLYEMLDKFKNNGLLEGNDQLIQLHAHAKVAHQLISKLEDNYKKSMKIEPGTLAFDERRKKAEVKGMTMSFYDHLVATVVNKYGHASKLYTQETTPGETAQTKLSHLFPRFEDRTFDLVDFLYTDIYQIEIDKLISDENKKMLAEKLGPEWKNILNQEFKEIERELHDGNVKNLIGIFAASERRQKKAGLMTFTGGVGHKSFEKADFKDIHRRMFGEYYKLNPTEMLCSEFVAHTTIAALYRLNLNLGKKLGLPEEAKVIKIPIGEHEDLNLIQPDRLLKILKDNHCVRVVEGPESVRKYIDKPK